MRILVVEDEPLLSMLLEENIVELGHEVAGSAATVAHALETVDKGRVDCALLDFSLGSSGNSVPIAERLRADGIPFTFLSGHQDFKHDQSVPEAPLLNKPFSLDQLDVAIRDMAAFSIR